MKCLKINNNIFHFFLSLTGNQFNDTNKRHAVLSVQVTAATPAFLSTLSEIERSVFPSGTDSSSINLAGNERVGFSTFV